MTLTSANTNHKFSAYTSILSGNTYCSPEQNIELLRLSLKKETDRKQKLQKLMQKYDHITSHEKNHIKSIKGSIIELKDMNARSKTKFYLNHGIYVDNNLAKETRQFLCMLLNTFYNKYEQNAECEKQTRIVREQMEAILNAISKNQENLLKIEKQVISRQVFLESELSTEKTKLKEQNTKHKVLDAQYQRIGIIFAENERKFKQQYEKVAALMENCKKREDKIQKLKEQVYQGQLVKKGKEQLMAGQINYQEKFNNEITELDAGIEREKAKELQLKRKIKSKKIKVQRLRRQKAQLIQSPVVDVFSHTSKPAICPQKLNHEVEMKIVDLRNNFAQCLIQSRQ